MTERRYIDRDSLGIARHKPGQGVGIGWLILLAFVIPIIGVIISIVMLARDRVGPGLAVLLASLLGAAVAFAVYY